MRNDPAPDAVMPPQDGAQWQFGHGRAVLQISAATAALIGGSGVAVANGVFTPPAGVSAYRLLFVTADETTASSGNIATYNSFVTGEAAQNTLLPTTLWKAIVSTTSISAAGNVSIGTAGDANVPIYLVDGTFVTSSTDAFFSQNIPGEPNENQFGNTNNTYTWTGSTSSGSAYTSYEAGGQYGTEMGSDYFEPAFVVDSADYDFYNGVANSPSDHYSLYALSGEIDVPEPASGSALLIGGLIVTRIFRRRTH
nr:hypothetical protein [uncultured Rhodopila sp.]